MLCAKICSDQKILIEVIAKQKFYGIRIANFISEMDPWFVTILPAAVDYNCCSEPRVVMMPTLVSPIASSAENWELSWCQLSRSLALEQFQKSQNAPVPYPTMPHSEQKCAHFCSEWGIVGYGTGTFWDLWIRSEEVGIMTTFMFQCQCNCKLWEKMRTSGGFLWHLPPDHCLKHYLNAVNVGIFDVYWYCAFFIIFRDLWHDNIAFFAIFSQ